MAVEYRSMLPRDEDAVFDLRREMWGGESREYVRQGAYLDPLYARHTFVAVEPDGTLLATVRYWLREIRDAGGAPRRVGCVASVATVERARRQGHARNLMLMALQAMREEGCDWSFLFSSGMGIPLYDSLDFKRYPTFYYKGRVKGRSLERGGGYSTQRLERPFDMQDGSWQAIRQIYDTFNAHRPLSLVRDEAYWRGYYARRLSSMPPNHGPVVYLATSKDAGAVAYLISRVALPDPENQQPHADAPFVVRELGFAPGHADALPSLIAAAIEDARNLLQPPGLDDEMEVVALLPAGDGLERTVRKILGPPQPLLEARRQMALPVSDTFTHQDLAAIFASPGAFFWPMDDF